MKPERLLRRVHKALLAEAANPENQMGDRGRCAIWADALEYALGRKDTDLAEYLVCLPDEPGEERPDDRDEW